MSGTNRAYLRGMFRSIGGIISTTIILFLVSRSPDQGDTLKGIFLVLGLLTPLTIPLILMTPTGREKPLEHEGPGSREAEVGSGAGQAEH